LINPDRKYNNREWEKKVNVNVVLNNMRINSGKDEVMRYGYGGGFF
jgi:hypothetical protein